MPILNEEEWEDFEKKIEEGLKNPVGLVPTPRLKNVVKLIKMKELEKNKGE